MIEITALGQIQTSEIKNEVKRIPSELQWTFFCKIYNVRKNLCWKSPVKLDYYTSHQKLQKGSFESSLYRCENLLLVITFGMISWNLSDFRKKIYFNLKTLFRL